MFLAETWAGLTAVDLDEVMVARKFLSMVFC